jgi:hypothetical protein
MRMTIVARVLGALLFVGVALVARNEARATRAEAGAWQDLVTLQLDAASAVAAPTDGGVMSAIGGATEDHRRAATIKYWLGRYDELADRHDSSTDPDVLFVAANAAFRAARRDNSVGPDAARRLDPVIQAYTTVLKATPRHQDAAYNLEYVARLRDQLRLMQKVPATPAGATRLLSGSVSTSDLPEGPTLHGSPGGPPADKRPEEFQILTPKDRGERQSMEPGQARGGAVRRKG